MNRYLAAVLREQEAHPEWRWGQTHYNVLFEFDPTAATAIEDAGLDPFYHEDRVRPMRAFLSTYWIIREARRLDESQ